MTEKMAKKHSVETSAHLSYPDREGFGRVSLDISINDLISSLDKQLNRTPEVSMVKLHGALYHDACNSPRLSGAVTEWFCRKKVRAVITLWPSELSKTCEAAGLRVLAEGFAERRYQYDPKLNLLTLVSRSKSHASMSEVDEAMAQVRALVEEGKVKAILESSDGTHASLWVETRVDTVCIHSDSKISLDLARRFRMEKGAWKR